MKIYIGGGFINRHDLGVLIRSGFYDTKMLSYFHIMTPNHPYAKNFEMTRAAMGKPHYRWYYHPESESYFVDRSDAEFKEDIVDLGQAISRSKQELEAHKERIRNAHKQKEFPHRIK